MIGLAGASVALNCSLCEAGSYWTGSGQDQAGIWRTDMTEESRFLLWEKAPWLRAVDVLLGALYDLDRFWLLSDY